MKRQLIWIPVIAAVFTTGFFLGRISDRPSYVVTSIDRMPAGTRDLSLSYSDVLTKVQAGEVQGGVTINGTSLTGRLTTGDGFDTTIPSDDPQM